MPTKATRKGERTASVTVTMPLSVLNQVDEEAQLMQRGFSDALTQLVRVAVLQRRAERGRDGP